MSTRLLKSPHPPPAPSWHETAGLAAQPGDKEGEKRSFLKKSSIPLAALISISKPVSRAMMHLLQRLNVPFPPPLSVREKINVIFWDRSPEDAGL